MLRQFRNTLIACGFLLAGVTAQAQTYNAALDFSILRNPNGVWSYGQSATLTSSLILFTNRNSVYLGGLEQWKGNISSDPKLTVVFNATTNPLGGVAPGHLALGPGANGEYSTVRWTAPVAGHYALTSLFTALGGGTTDVHVLRDKIDLFDGLTTTIGTTASYSIQLGSVAAGETIDFKVGYGNGNYLNDFTGLDAQIVDFDSVPEPGAVALLVAGVLPGMEMLRRRRK